MCSISNNQCAGSSTVSAVTGSDGQYAIDSSQFNESIVAGFQVGRVSASAVGYLNYNVTGNPLLP